jgi:hypothetical protein
MNPPSPFAAKSLLGAALAGLSLVPTDAEAAVYVEGTDFSNSSATATDLTSSFADFLNNHGVVGSLNTGGGDFADYLTLNVAPSTATTINYRASATGENNYFGLIAYDSSFGFLNSAFLPDVLVSTPAEGSISFTTPANGIVI